MADSRVAVGVLATLLVLVVFLSGALLFVMHWRAVSSQRDRWQLYEVSDVINGEIHSLDFYLLSGSPDELQRLINTHRLLLREIEDWRLRKVTPSDDKQFEKLGKDEQVWYEKVALPSMQARKQLDAGTMKFIDMQMTYFEADSMGLRERLLNDLKNIRLSVETSQ